MRTTLTLAPTAKVVDTTSSYRALMNLPSVDRGSSSVLKDEPFSASISVTRDYVDR